MSMLITRLTSDPRYPLDLSELILDFIGWDWISKQPLSEEHIRQYQNKVNWWHIMIHQTLSTKFTRDFLWN